MVLRKGILEFGVWIGAVLMAVTLIREYFATGLSARIFVASFVGSVVAALVSSTLFGALEWRQSGRLEKTSRV
jgi:predicted membrane channel-forming protein YqfA (hemolysin III family)